MSKFTVYQIDSSVDANLETMRDLMCFGSEAYKPEMIDLFRIVAEVESDDLEMVFHWMNRPGWQSDEDRVTLYRRAHSLSIGDIIYSYDDCGFHMVDREGFTKIHIDSDTKNLEERINALQERVAKLVA